MKNYKYIKQLFGIICVIIGIIGILTIFGILMSKISILILIGYLFFVLCLIGTLILNN